MYYVIRLTAYAMHRDAAIETFERAWKDAKKTKFEDANTGPVIWGHLSRQSGLEMGQEEELRQADDIRRYREAAAVGL